MSNGVNKMVRRMSAAALCALAFLSGFWALTGVLTTPVAAVAGINEQINFQGRLFNGQGAVVPDGYYNIEFKIYQDGDGLSVGNTTGSPAGSLEWTESFLNSNGKGVLVKNGYMSVELGSVNPFGNQVDWNQSTLWLSMNIGNTNTGCASFATCGPDGEMTPMKRLSSTPYAMNAGKLGGLTSAGFIQNTTTPQTADFAITGAGSATTLTGTTSVLSPLVDTASAVSLSIGTSSATSVTIGKSGGTTTLASANLTLGTPTSATTLVAATQSTADTAGSALTIRGATGNGTGAGGAVSVTGGTGGATNGNGGNLNLAGGAATGTGVKGLVKLGASAYDTITNAACATSCVIPQASVDGYGTVIISASVADITITLPAPTLSTTEGRVVYLTTATTSQDFTLSTNSGGDTVQVAMRKNTTATMIWNGTAWTPGGASNATTLQATYGNGTNPATTPEIKLDSIRGTIDIQDADTTIGSDILNIRGSNTGGLGTVLFGVSNTGRVTIQGTTDQSSAFRVLDSNGEYLLNVNSSNGYIINNSTNPAGNDIPNPGFESGGQITGGEEGWFGPAQSTIINTNTNNGNYAMQVTANTADMDVFAGTFYEVRPGDNLYFQGNVKNSAGADGTGGVQITWYDKDKAVLSRTSDYLTQPGTSYVLRKVSGVAPANAQYARVSATVRAAATTGTYYFDDFYLKKNVEIADSTFRNAADSTAAFRIQSASSAQTLFTADTTNNILKVGDNTGTNTATTILVVDGATADPTSLANKNGGLFYRSDTGSLKAIIGGAVVDVCTTAVTCSGYSGSAGSTVQLQGTSPGIKQTGNFNITGTGMLTRLQSQDESTASTNSSALNIVTGNATGVTSNSGNLVLDVGTATGTRGTITIGTGAVAVTMGGSLNVQGSNALSLGTASTASGSILFRNSAGANTITLRAPGANPTASYNLTLPQNLGSAGDCLKDSGSGALAFSNCAAGTTTNLQDVYNNSSSPATTTLADGKDIKYVLQDTTTDPNFVVQLQCVTSCGSDGRFAIRNAADTADIFRVSPNGSGITLNGYTQVGSSTTDSTQTNFQLDSYNGVSDTGTCNNSSNQGSLYYNTTTGTIRACVTSGWTDISNPEQLGLLSFGVVPQSGSQPYDLPALATAGVSGPCKVSRSSATQVTWQDCVAYSGGVRVAVTGGTITLGTSAVNQWRHLCLVGTDNQPAWSGAGNTSAVANMPTFSVTEPVLCIASVRSSASTAANIGQIYDTRTFTSAIKEAVITSTAVELGSVVDSAASGALVPAAAGSAKLYAAVVATNGSTSSTTPNAIVVTTGAAWVKATAGTAGQFTKTSATAGYVDTIASVPNNSFYYSAGNTRTSYNATCTTAANCSGSLYVNLIVR